MAFKYYVKLIQDLPPYVAGDIFSREQIEIDQVKSFIYKKIDSEAFFSEAMFNEVANYFEPVACKVKCYKDPVGRVVQVDEWEGVSDRFIDSLKKNKNLFNLEDVQ